MNRRKLWLILDNKIYPKYLINVIKNIFITEKHKYPVVMDNFQRKLLQRKRRGGWAFSLLLLMFI